MMNGQGVSLTSTQGAQEAVACLAACQARARLALTTRATSEAEARLGATSGDVLESEEFMSLSAVLDALKLKKGKGDSCHTPRGHTANGLIELVRASTWPCAPSPWLCALLRWRDLTPCRIRATPRAPPPWRTCRPRSRAAQASL